MFYTFHIAGYKTFFKYNPQIVQPVIIFSAPFTLWVVQPAI